MNKIKHFSIGILAILIFSFTASAQLLLPANSTVGLNFDAFRGTGFSPTPTAGQLNSNTVVIGGMSDPPNSLNFGDTATTGDFARGMTTGGVTTGGTYAFDRTGGNFALGTQPAASDFNPGTITIRVQNTSGVALTSVTVTYNIIVRNDQGRSSSFNLSFSQDQTTSPPAATFTPAGTDYTSPEAADAAPTFVAVPRTTVISGLNVPNNGFLNIRFNSADVAGAGSRDEIGVDDFTISNLAPTAAPGTITGRARTASGRGIKHAVIMLTGGDLESPIYATTNQFGYYQFQDVEVGQSYALQINSGRYSFQNSSRVINLDDNLTDEDFIADSPGTGRSSDLKTVTEGRKTSNRKF